MRVRVAGAMPPRPSPNPSKIEEQRCKIELNPTVQRFMHESLQKSFQTLPHPLTPCCSGLFRSVLCCSDVPLLEPTRPWRLGGAEAASTLCSRNSPATIHRTTQQGILAAGRLYGGLPEEVREPHRRCAVEYATPFHCSIASTARVGRQTDPLPILHEHSH